MNKLRKLLGLDVDRATIRRVQEANERFNILRLSDGSDVITYNGVVVSCPTDKDILNRLDYMRQHYIYN